MPQTLSDDCRNPHFWWHYSTLRPSAMLGCYDLMVLGSIKFKGETKVEIMPKPHISLPEMDIQRKHQLWPMNSWVETCRSSIQPASGHLGMWATLLGCEQEEHRQTWMYRDNSTNTNWSLRDKQRLHLVTLMHELIQDVVTVHLAPNLKPHSPNMFPTSGVARLKRSLEEWPRSERCE